MHLPVGIETPATVIDRDRLDANVAEMQAWATKAGVALRPHAKTHKCAQIAHRQLDAGAVGLTVATIREAEVFADHGADDLFIAYPLWVTDAAQRRLEALGKLATLQVGVDSAAAVERLAALAGRPGAPKICVELDSGHHRSGVRPDRAGEVALAAARAGFDVVGVFTFPGHSYGPSAAAPAARDENEALRAGAASFEAAGLRCEVRSGGSTPSARSTLSDRDTACTEVRPGVYVFNDAQQVELRTSTFDRVALAVASRVVSRPSGDRVILDAGSKVIGADRAVWATGHGRLLDWPDARIVALSEHHATVTFGPEDVVPDLGQVVAVVPNHVCAAVNLVDELLVAAGGTVVGTWAVAARGANR